MCFSYSVNLQGKTIPTDLNISSANNSHQLGFFFNGFDHPNLPIISKIGEIEIAQWGIIPKWIKSNHEAVEISNKTLNARIESIENKPSFSEAWKNNPCLILASGFLNGSTEIIIRTRFTFFQKIMKFYYLEEYLVIGLIQLIQNGYAHIVSLLKRLTL